MLYNPEERLGDAQFRPGYVGGITSNWDFDNEGQCFLSTTARCLTGFTLEEVIGRSMLMTKTGDLPDDPDVDYMPLACGNIVLGNLSPPTNVLNPLLGYWPALGHLLDARDNDGDSCDR